MKLPVTRSAALAAWFVLLLLGLTPAVHSQIPTATWDWAVRGSSTGSANALGAVDALQVDAAGNTYIMGVFTNALTLGSITLVSQSAIGTYIAKLAPDGTTLWARQLEGTPAPATAHSLALYSLNNVFLTGSFSGTMTIGSLRLTDPLVAGGAAGTINGFVAKLDSLGMPQWAVRVGSVSTATSQPAYAYGLHADAAGNLTISGIFTGPTDVAGRVITPASATQPTFYVAHLRANASGPPTPDWVDTPVLDQPAIQSAVGVDALNNTYVVVRANGPATFGTVQLPGTPGVPGLFVAQYDAAGTVNWGTILFLPFSSSGPATPEILDLGVSAADGAYVLTRTTIPAPNYSRNYQVTKITSYGRPNWYSGPFSPASGTNLNDLALDAMGNVYVAGDFIGSVFMSGLTLSSASPANQEACLFSFTSQGVLRWGSRISSGSGDEPLTALAVGVNGSLHVGSTVSGAAQFGPFALPATSAPSEVVVARLAVNTITATQAATASPLLLAPNPAHGTTTLTLPAASSPQPLTLLDALGRPVRQYTVPAGTTTAPIELAGLPAGLYVLRGAGASRKLVVE